MSAPSIKTETLEDSQMPLDGMYAILTIPVPHLVLTELASSDTYSEHLRASSLQPSVLPPPSVTLSDEQKEVLQMVMSGQNVFFTGSAGSYFLIIGPQTLPYLEYRHREVGLAP